MSFIINGEEVEYPEDTTIKCWYDSHSFTSCPLFIPLSNINNVWTMKGNFCSINCLKSFLIEENPYNRDELIGRSIVFARQYLCIPCVSISKSPSKYELSIYGGNKSILDFRKSFTFAKKMILSVSNNFQTQIKVRHLDSIRTHLPKALSMSSRSTGTQTSKTVLVKTSNIKTISFTSWWASRSSSVSQKQERGNNTETHF